MNEEHEHYCPTCDVIVRARDMVEDGICPYCDGLLHMDTGEQGQEGEP